MTASSQKKPFGPVDARFVEDPDRPGIEVSQWFEECEACEGTGRILLISTHKFTKCVRCKGSGWAEAISNE